MVLAGCSGGPGTTWCDDVETIVQGVGVLTGSSPLIDGSYAELRSEMAAAAERAQDGPTDDASLAARAVAESLTTAASRVDRPDFDPQDRSRPTLAVLSELTRTAATLAGQYAVNCD